MEVITMNKKTLIISGILVAVLGLGYFGATQVFADENNWEKPRMIQRLIERFGLNEKEVDQFITEERETTRQEMQAKRRAEIEEKLAQAVTEGKITEEQKGLLLAKMEEHMSDNNRTRPAEIDGWQEMTREERQSIMEQKRSESESRRAEFESWADQNGINLGDLGIFGFGPEGGFGLGDGFGGRIKGHGGFGRMDGSGQGLNN